MARGLLRWGSAVRQVIRPASPNTYTQTYSTADRTVANPTAAAVTTTAATNTSPYGYATQAQADALVAAVNALIIDVADLRQTATAMVDDLQAVGIVA